MKKHFYFVALAFLSFRPILQASNNWKKSFNDDEMTFARSVVYRGASMKLMNLQHDSSSSKGLSTKNSKKKKQKHAFSSNKPAKLPESMSKVAQQSNNNSLHHTNNIPSSFYSHQQQSMQNNHHRSPASIANPQDLISASYGQKAPLTSCTTLKNQTHTSLDPYQPIHPYNTSFQNAQSQYIYENTLRNSASQAPVQLQEKPESKSGNRDQLSNSTQNKQNPATSPQNSSEFYELISKVAQQSNNNLLHHSNNISFSFYSHQQQSMQNIHHRSPASIPNPQDLISVSDGEQAPLTPCTTLKNQTHTSCGDNKPIFLKSKKEKNRSKSKKNVARYYRCVNPFCTHYSEDCKCGLISENQCSQDMKTDALTCPHCNFAVEIFYEYKNQAQPVKELNNHLESALKNKKAQPNPQKNENFKAEKRFLRDDSKLAPHSLNSVQNSRRNYNSINIDTNRKTFQHTNNGFLSYPQYFDCEVNNKVDDAKQEETFSISIIEKESKKYVCTIENLTSTTLVRDLRKQVEKKVRTKDKDFTLSYEGKNLTDFSYYELKNRQCKQRAIKDNTLSHYSITHKAVLLIGCTIASNGT